MATPPYITPWYLTIIPEAHPQRKTVTLWSYHIHACQRWHSLSIRMPAGTHLTQCPKQQRSFSKYVQSLQLSCQIGKGLTLTPKVVNCPFFLLTLKEEIHSIILPEIIIPTLSSTIFLHSILKQRESVGKLPALVVFKINLLLALKTFAL